VRDKVSAAVARGAGAPGCIPIWTEQCVTIGFCQEWLSWHDRRKASQEIFWTTVGIIVPLLVTIVGWYLLKCAQTNRGGRNGYPHSQTSCELRTLNRRVPRFGRQMLRRSSVAVATSRERQRSPRLGREGQHDECRRRRPYLPGPCLLGPGADYSYADIYSEGPARRGAVSVTAKGRILVLRFMRQS